MSFDPLDAARRAYLSDTIDLGEFEAAVEHVLRGGLADDRFPFLPAVLPLPDSIFFMERR